jgi:HEPN domain-containing protein
VPDDVLGFHVQQAVEKRLKAVLAFHEVEYDRTHSVSYLTALLERHGVSSPPCREQIEGLTPWAVAARYEDTFQEVLDRAAARQLLSELRDWSQRILSQSPSPGD